MKSLADCMCSVGSRHVTNTTFFVIAQLKIRRDQKLAAHSSLPYHRTCQRLLRVLADLNEVCFGTVCFSSPLLLTRC